MHRGLTSHYSKITEDTLHALSLCTNLRSMTWVGDFKRFSGSDSVFLSFLSVIRNHPLRSLTIRTHSDVGEEAWAELTKLTGLRKVSIWCLEGPPYLLGNGWANRLRSTLTHLELGVSAFLYPCSECTSVLIFTSLLFCSAVPGYRTHFCSQCSRSCPCCRTSG